MPVFTLDELMSERGLALQPKYVTLQNGGAQEFQTKEMSKAHRISWATYKVLYCEVQAADIIRTQGKENII